MKQILLVDDQAHVLRVLKRSLENNGFTVEVALGAEVALNMLSESATVCGMPEFDVVITDLDMPIMDGCDLARVIVDSYGSHSPLVLVAGECEESQQTTMLANLAGVEQLKNPMSLNRLMERLNTYFGCYEQRLAS